MQSPKKIDMITTTKMVEKVDGNQVKGETLKGIGPETLAIDVDMVGFILS